MMSEFTDRSKFSVRSLPSIFLSVANLVSGYRARDWRFPGRTFTREIFLNSLLVAFASLSPDRQDEMLRDGMLGLARRMGEVDPTFGEDVLVDDVPSSAKPSRRRSS